MITVDRAPLRIPKKISIYIVSPTLFFLTTILSSYDLAVCEFGVYRYTGRSPPLPLFFLIVNLDQFFLFVFVRKTNALLQ